ncbi:unnamed protein product [Didymodactylos carnosus]|nr:unnamed protein product [Didymodactylos carnosus]CAF3721449.1 unnamed protein product [Didymodactylos carnosus]
MYQRLGELVNNICIDAILLVLCTSTLIAEVECRKTSPPLLLLVSFDGFRYDYPDMYSLENFHLLNNIGVRAQSISAFATTTFPNHFTMITGVYQETHGIISNNMYDPVMKSVFKVETMNDTRWWSQNSLLETIWKTNEVENINERKSGVIGWPVSLETPINGHRPSKYEVFEKKRQFKEIIDTMISWFLDEKEPINFGSIYYREPDAVGHRYGPNSKEVNVTVHECDELLGYLMNKINTSDLLKNDLNVIIASDHGMEQVNGINNLTYIDDYVNTSLFHYYGTVTVISIFPHADNDTDVIYENLTKIPHSVVYKKNDIPDNYHYKNNIRIGPILLVADGGFEILSRPVSKNISDGSFDGNITSNFDRTKTHGNHGYDNSLKTMRSIFYAYGPQFRKNFTSSIPFYNVDLYSLMCIILDIKNIRQTNGSFNNIKDFLLDQSKINSKIFGQSSIFSFASSLPTIVLVAILLSLIMGVVWSIITCRYAPRPIHVESVTTTIPHRYQLLSTNDNEHHQKQQQNTDNKTREFLGDNEL